MNTSDLIDALDRKVDGKADRYHGHNVEFFLLALAIILLVVASMQVDKKVDARLAKLEARAATQPEGK